MLGNQKSFKGVKKVTALLLSKNGYKCVVIELHF